MPDQDSAREIFVYSQDSARYRTPGDFRPLNPDGFPVEVEPPPPEVLADIVETLTADVPVIDPDAEPNPPTPQTPPLPQTSETPGGVQVLASGVEKMKPTVENSLPPSSNNPNPGKAKPPAPASPQ